MTAAEDRAREHENAWRAVLPRRALTVVRVDGRGFSGYTRGLDKPFDSAFAADMDAAALALAKEVDGAVLAFVQSDEISVVAADYAEPGTQPWMGGVVAKIVSLTAVRTSLAFSAARAERGQGPAMFDSRAFSVPAADDAVAYLAWRQADARRNSLAMICDSVLGKKATVGKNTRWRRQALAEAGVVPEDRWPPGLLSGRIVAPRTVVGDVEYVNKRTGLPGTAVGVTRRVWETADAPDLSDPQFLRGLLPHCGDIPPATGP